uniref:Uncharacterized protein n=1 Tax=Daucus carota subsp. sativus TaxID=79200 RepID=A0A165WR89_DAUCS
MDLLFSYHSISGQMVGMSKQYKYVREKEHYVIEQMISESCQRIMENTRTKLRLNHKEEDTHHHT